MSVQQENGRKMAIIIRQTAIDNYYKNPIFCKQCGKILEVEEKRPSEIRKKKYCNHSCAARYTNSKFPKKKSIKRLCPLCKEHHTKKSRCRFCYIKELNKQAGSITKGQLFSQRKSWQSARSTIRKHADSVFGLSGKEKKCHKCGYLQYVEIHHKKKVSLFPNDAALSVINHIDNLIALCPNHHSEIENSNPLPNFILQRKEGNYMKSVSLFSIKATATTDGTTKSARAIEKQIKDALKAVSIDGVKLVVKQSAF